MSKSINKLFHLQSYYIFCITVVVADRFLLKANFVIDKLLKFTQIFYLPI